MDLALKVFIFCVICVDFSLSSLQIKNFTLTKCDKSSYSITVQDVNLHLDNGKLSVTGSLNTTRDLEAPIEAKVKVKRYFWVWVEIPCIDHLGSCTYLDLCSYGFPETRNCPQTFTENGVPCRCPIKKGYYKIPPQIFKSQEKNSWESGYYKGQAIISSSSTTLACYSFSFQLYTNFQEGNEPAINVI